jgi:hypothetical protein
MKRALLIGLIGLSTVSFSCAIADEQNRFDMAHASTHAKPIYQCSEREVGEFLAGLQKAEPSITERMIKIARRNIDQPYELYLLGEAPFETIDNQPIYCLGKSDCVVFVEHTLAMSLTDDFPSFLTMLQRIRYKDGAIGVLSRNHYTEADWNKNNAWLVREITDEIAGKNVVKFSETVDRQKFFKGRYKIETQIPVQTIHETFIPFEKIESVKGQLRQGDIVNFVSGQKGGYWVGHVGLVAMGANSEVHLIHSAAPKVREEKIEDYIARATKDLAEKDAAGKSRFYGFKFLRLTEDPIARLKSLDGPDAPHVTVPKESKIGFAEYLQQVGKSEKSAN